MHRRAVRTSTPRPGRPIGPRASPARRGSRRRCARHPRAGPLQVPGSRAPRAVPEKSVFPQAEARGIPRCQAIQQSYALEHLSQRRQKSSGVFSRGPALRSSRGQRRAGPPFRPAPLRASVPSPSFPPPGGRRYDGQEELGLEREGQRGRDPCLEAVARQSSSMRDSGASAAAIAGASTSGDPRRAWWTTPRRKLAGEGRISDRRSRARRSRSPRL